MSKQNITILASAVIAVAVIVVAANLKNGNEDGISSDVTTPTRTTVTPVQTNPTVKVLMGEAVSLLEATHIQEGVFATYNSNPPSSGRHFANPAEWGVYEKPIQDERVVHNLEHGGIWISYGEGVSNDEIAKLNAFAVTYPKAVIVSPRAQNDSAIALVSWGRVLKLDSVDSKTIDDFIQSNVNNSPERFAQIPAAKK